MLTIAPDFARRIDLPGAGPCPRPVDIDQARSGFSTLVSLRVYSFAQDVVIDGEAEDDEVFIVLLGGRADIAVTAHERETMIFSLDGAGGQRAVYMPSDAAYRLTARTDCDIAYARVKPVGSRRPATQGFTPDGGQLEIVGYATAMDLAAVTLRTGAIFTPAARDGDLPERFIHVRHADEAAVHASGQQVRDWTTLALASGEAATLTIDNGTADILMISATAH